MTKIPHPSPRDRKAIQQHNDTSSWMHARNFDKPTKEGLREIFRQAMIETARLQNLQKKGKR